MESLRNGVGNIIRKPSSKVKLYSEFEGMLAHVHQALISSGYGAQAFSDVLITITL
jgi:hypothetical protein